MCKPLASLQTIKLPIYTADANKGRQSKVLPALTLEAVSI